MVSARLAAKSHSSQVQGSLFTHKTTGELFLVSGKKKDLSLDSVNSLYNICGTMTQLTQAEQQELREIFHRYTLEFSDLIWTKMTLKPKYYLQ